MNKNGVFKKVDLYQAVKIIHKNIYTIDSHCDAPVYFPYGGNLAGNNSPLVVNRNFHTNEKSMNYVLKTDIPKMQKGMLDAVFMIAYLKQGDRNEKTSYEMVKKAKLIIKEIIFQVKANENLAEISYIPEDIKRLKSGKKKAIFIGLENGYGLGKDISNLEKFFNLGVSYMTLCHNKDNDLCDSSVESVSEHNGLSKFGEKVIKEMNHLGMMIDISHASEKTSFDVLKISEYPIIASHSSAKALCDHPRNISDSLMRAIAQKNGVIQVCLYSKFLKKNGKATIKDAVDHIDYIIKKVGIDHIGIGSDFDGGGGLKDLKSTAEMPKITMELLQRGYPEEAIAKIWGGNLMRVMQKVRRLV